MLGITMLTTKILSIDMPSAIKLNDIKLSATMLSVIMLSVIMLSVIILSAITLSVIKRCQIILSAITLSGMLNATIQNLSILAVQKRKNKKTVVVHGMASSSDMRQAGLPKEV